jgi:hypothetical protein
MIIVEPHADDAFLSMGGIIEEQVKSGNKVTICTVYSGTRKRAADAKAYADAVGAEWIGLGFEESGMFMDGPPAPISVEKIQGIFDNLAIVVPLGVGQHPEHLYVREIFEKCYEGYLWYYVDQPYASKLMWQDDLATKTYGREIKFCMRPGTKKFRHAKLFKDQSKFFYYNNEESLFEKTFELVVR